MFAVDVPLPLVTVHVCAGPLGWVETVTLYGCPYGIAVLNCVVVLVPLTGRNSVPFCSTRPVPERPETVTPIAWVPVVHVTATFVTLAVTVPLPPDTVHVCGGVVGAAATVTEKGLLATIAVLN